MKSKVIGMCMVALTVFSCKRNDELKPQLVKTNIETATLVEQAVTLTPVLIAGCKEHSGYIDATGTNARFNQPKGIFVNFDGTLLVADNGNQAVRKITNSMVSTVVKNSRFFDLTDLAATKDSTIGLISLGQAILYKNGALTFLDDPGCSHCTESGIDKSADGTFFWYTDNLADGPIYNRLFSMNSSGERLPGGGTVMENAPSRVSSVSTTLLDNKFIIAPQTIFEFTHLGAVFQIVPSMPFEGLTDIVANNDGTKLYIADNGTIKMITRCPTCKTVITSLTSNVGATGLALAHSQKVLFFTSAQHHTVSKINL